MKFKERYTSKGEVETEVEYDNEEEYYEMQHHMNKLEREEGKRNLIDWIIIIVMISLIMLSFKLQWTWLYVVVWIIGIPCSIIYMFFRRKRIK